MTNYAYSKTLLCWIFILGFSLTSFAQQGPILESPPWNVSLGNGTKDLKIGIFWTFSWYPVHYAQQYQIEIENLYGGGKFSANTTTTSFDYRRSGYIENQSIGGWFWKVRAQINGVWGPWSETRYFNVIEAAEKAYPINYYGDGFYKIQAAYSHYFLGQSERWFTDYMTERILVSRPEGNELTLFQFEGTSPTQEIYHIKVYSLPPGKELQFIGYLTHDLEIKLQEKDQWNILFAQHARQFQIPGTNIVLQITNDYVGTALNNYTQRQYLKLIPY